MIGANNWTVVRFAWPKSSDYDGIEFYGEKTGSCHRNKLEKGIFLTVSVNFVAEKVECFSVIVKLSTM